MKCVLVSCFNTYGDRIKSMQSFFEEKGYECTYITSDYDHISKVRYKSGDKNVIQIKVLKYAKNLSLKRLVSHFFFSAKAYKKLYSLEPDLIYAILPPNALAPFMARYKGKSDAKLIFDLYDLWPETFPSIKAKGIFRFIFSFWANLRNRYLKYADHVITECNLYQDILSNELKGLNTSTIYPILSGEKVAGTFEFDQDRVHLCYLGTINNIIDIPMIARLVHSINLRKPVVVHVIGAGEKRELFLNELEKAGAQVKYHGEIYDADEKQMIFDKCHFGLNIMKESVCVGLTLKSIGYFAGGVPILNNIKADTAELVNEYGIGFNIDSSNVSEQSSVIVYLNRGDLTKMKERTFHMFENLFEYPPLFSGMEAVLEDILSH